MSLIEWSRLPGEAIEDAVAMLLCSENFEATQVQPGQGDGGIDVFVPQAADLSIREIYQVKRYSSRLTSSEKRKIKRSLDRVVETAKKGGWTISAWRLVLPLKPTPNDLAWLDSLGKDHPFPCRWVGLNRLETLAAMYPQVIDYYLRDGKERLQAQTDRLAAIIAGRSERRAGEELQPIDVMGDLRGIYEAINECDPHYRYEISMTAEPPSPELGPAPTPGLVAVASRGFGGMYINISIIARSMAAIEKRPITGKLSVAFSDGDENRESFEKFVNFGTPVSIPPGRAKVNLDLPGGLGGDLSDPAVVFGPAEETGDDDTAERELVIAALSPSGETLAEVEVQLVEVTVGQAGGRRTVWRDGPGFITLEILAKEYPDLTVNISINVNASKKKPTDIVSSLKFLANMHKPNTLAISQAFGPRNYSTRAVSGQERDADFARMAKIAAALATIQNYSSTRILFPESFTGDQARNIIRAAQILSGKPTSASWNQIKVNLDPSAREARFAAGETASIRLIRDMVIEIDGKEYVVGKEAAFMHAIPTKITDQMVIFEPSETDPKAVFVRFDGDAEDGRVQVARTDPTQSGL
ncbi:restriction endonuclease [Prescottella equi]|uniref:restriction endonuclease n=1 Tax=Rhodococcus hoagii TaxID=43767 RepID=UPI002741417D|nr:restriction endonuclease [Prescottella equi]MDP8017644.1 restriction endonuclease [Prescottella equi]